MKSRLLILFLVTTTGLSSGAVFASISDNKILSEFGDKQKVQYQQLKADTSNFFGSVNKPFSIPNFLYGEPLFTPNSDEEQYEVIINRFFQTYPDLFQTTINDFRIEIEQPKDRNITQVHLFQKYQNVPVFGAEAIFTFNDQHELISYLGKYIPNIDTNVKPNSTPVAVKQIVAQDLRVDVIAQEPRLFIFNKGVLTNTKENTQLVWRLGANGWVYFVNANTKEIVYKYEDVNSALSREVYSAGGGTPTLPGTLEISEGDDISTLPDGDDAKNAYNYSEDVYNYYYTNFNLDSFDDSGSAMTATVDFDLTSFYGVTLGAAWCNFENPDSDPTLCPSTRQLIFEDGYTVLDIAAHEWTHGIDDYAVRDEDAGLYGLIYSDESGALNESYSDIFGVLIEAEYGDGLDWDIGEDLSVGAVRSLYDPTLHDQPDNTSDQCTAINDYCDYSDDNGGVHTNSGIPNKAAYLIMRESSEGIETFNSTDVTGIGLEKAEHIFYYALRDELITSATFDDNFNALLQTCLTLEVITIDTADCESVFDAYTAIGVNTDSSYIEAAVTASAETGYAPLTVDFDGSDSFALNATITDYVWDLDSTSDSDGDGSTTNDTDNTGPIAAYTYVSAGTVQARLTVTDDTGNYTHTTTTITVYEPIEASFTITGDHTTASATVSFDASTSTGSITDYTWDFGDGTTTSSGTTATITHTYSNPGSYPVILTVTDDHGYTQTAEAAAVLYVSGSITSNINWSADYSPYVISGGVTVSSGYTVTIEPGTVIKFYDTTSSLTVDGTLDAQGTSTDGIVFTSYQDDDNGGDTNDDSTATTPAAGDWLQIDLNSGSVVALDYATIQYGGSTVTSGGWGSTTTTYYPLVNVESDSVTMTNTMVTEGESYGVSISSASPTLASITITSTTYGLYITGSASPVVESSNFDSNTYGSYITDGSPTITDNTFDANTYGVYVNSSTATPTITDNTFTNHTYYPIYLADWLAGTVLSGNTGSDNTYNAISIYKVRDAVTLSADNELIYVANYLHVYAGSSVTIDPGVIIKFIQQYSWAGLDGTVQLNGTEAEPIVFTALADDTYGGDTNNDGSTTTPAAGDWSYIEIESTANIIMDNTIIQYGGRSSHEMLTIESDAVTITDSTLADSDSEVIVIDGVDPTLNNNTITNSSDTGIYLTNASEPTLTGNTISNHTYGIYSYSGVPTITDNIITNNDYGIYTTTSRTTVTNNVIADNTSFGVYNSSGSTLTAENNWWGDASGPYHATSNPSGTGDRVSASVDFDPWTTTDPTADVTPPSDVTLGTTHKDVWAQTITPNWTNPTDSDFDHVQIDRTDLLAGTTTTLSSAETGTSYIDTTPSYNTTYTYTLYAVDTTGNVSTGVTTANQRLRNPAPTNLVLTTGDTTIAATWNTSFALAATVGGYIVYYGTSRTALTNSIDVGNVTSTTLTGLTNYTRYFVAVTAYNTSGTESSQSGIRATRPHP